MTKLDGFLGCQRTARPGFEATREVARCWFRAHGTQGWPAQVQELGDRVGGGRWAMTFPRKAVNPSALGSDTVLCRGGTRYDDAHRAGRPGYRSVSFWGPFGRRARGLHDPAIRT